MKIIKANSIEHNPKIAIVVSRFHEMVTSALLEGALEKLKEFEIDSQSITVVYVPGAVEIPVVAQRLAHSFRNRFSKSYQQSRYPVATFQKHVFVHSLPVPFYRMATILIHCQLVSAIAKLDC